jgi:hypothetical protein
MSEKVTFSAFDPIRFDRPSPCDVCTSQPPMFHYDASDLEERRLATFGAPSRR